MTRASSLVFDLKNISTPVCASSVRNDFSISGVNPPTSDCAAFNIERISPLDEERARSCPDESSIAPSSFKTFCRYVRRSLGESGRNSITLHALAMLFIFVLDAEFAARTIGTVGSLSIFNKASAPPKLLRPCMPSTSSMNIIGSPLTLRFPSIGTSVSLIPALFRISLALSPTISYPNDFAARVAAVVLPTPGGPTRRMGFIPFFHLENHSTSAARASSFPTICAILSGR